MTSNQILRFCQLHDWGQGAYIEQDRICGILERWTERQDDGSVKLHEEEITLPIDLSAIRDWAGY